MVELTVGKVDPKDTYRVRVVKYLSDRTLADMALEEACKKQNKTLDGVMNYIVQEAKKVAVSCEGGKGAWLEDDEVWNWAVHYILEDSIDCEPKKVEPTPYKPFDYEQWKKDHPTPITPPKGKSVIEHSGQLVFDF